MLMPVVNHSGHDFSGTKVEDAMKSLGLEDVKDCLPGSKLRLYPHQILGMRHSENACSLLMHAL